MGKYSRYTVVVDNISSSTPTRDLEVGAVCACAVGSSVLTMLVQSCHRCQQCCMCVSVMHADSQHGPAGGRACVHSRERECEAANICRKLHAHHACAAPTAPPLIVCGHCVPLDPPLTCSRSSAMQGASGACPHVSCAGSRHIRCVLVPSISDCDVMCRQRCRQAEWRTTPLFWVHVLAGSLSLPPPLLAAGTWRGTTRHAVH